VSDLTIPVEGAVLSAKLTLPEGGPAPALVGLHGAGEGERAWYLYEHLHDLLPPAGVAAVTFDRRGSGASSGESSRGNFPQQAEDALAVVEHVSSLPGVDPERIGLWGISQGCWVAPLAATMSPRVAFLVLVASVGVTPGEQMRWAAHFQATRDFGEEAGERAASAWDLAHDWIRGGDRAPLEGAIAQARTESWWANTHLPDEIPPDEARDAIRAELDFEPGPVFAQVRVPTLLFYGDEDEWIPVDESIAAWRQARGDAVDVVVISGVGHEPAVEEVVSPVYERELLAWLHRVVL
jgi:pimeloyl-ACP methyl ester carboxylesterase